MRNDNIASDHESFRGAGKIAPGDESGPGSGGAHTGGKSEDEIGAMTAAHMLRVDRLFAFEQMIGAAPVISDPPKNDVACGSMSATGGNSDGGGPAPSPDPQSSDSKTKSETWYYMYRVNGKAHAMVYDPTTKTVYEINSPKDENKKDIPTWKSAVNGAPLSFAYKYSQGNKEEWKVLAQREAGKKFALCPINVPNPEAARNWFDANTGHTWWYALGAENCSIYVFKGLRAGGADIHHVYSPAPSSVNSKPTVYWYFPEKP